MIKFIYKENINLNVNKIWYNFFFKVCNQIYPNWTQFQNEAISKLNSFPEWGHFWSKFRSLFLWFQHRSWHCEFISVSQWGINQRLSLKFWSHKVPFELISRMRPFPNWTHFQNEAISGQNLEVYFFGSNK